MERAIENIMKKHREEDQNKTESKGKESEEKFVETLSKRVLKIRAWLNHNDDKPGKTGKPRKSNITDNESAKMKTHRGVIQGYDGVAATDGKHQVIVQAEAFGEAQEHDLLEPMVKEIRKNFQECKSVSILGNAIDMLILCAPGKMHKESGKNRHSAGGLLCRTDRRRPYLYGSDEA